MVLTTSKRIGRSGAGFKVRVTSKLSPSPIVASTVLPVCGSSSLKVTEIDPLF